MVNKGDRVGAISSADETQVKIFGFGVYDGRIVHPELGIPNPRITLDSGEVVWGCECWWGAEAKIKASIGDRETVIVAIDRDAS